MTAAAGSRAAAATVDAEVAAGDQPRFAQLLLEELIYERVRTQIDLLELTWFEAELDASIGRVLGKLDDPDAPAPPALAQHLVNDAWTRVEAEWREQRRRPREECPLCEAEPPDDGGFGR